MCFLTTNLQSAEIWARLAVSSDEQPSENQNPERKDIGIQQSDQAICRTD